MFFWGVRNSICFHGCFCSFLLALLFFKVQRLLLCQHNSTLLREALRDDNGSPSSVCFPLSAVGTCNGSSSMTICDRQQRARTQTLCWAYRGTRVLSSCNKQLRVNNLIPWRFSTKRGVPRTSRELVPSVVTARAFCFVDALADALKHPSCEWLPLSSSGVSLPSLAGDNNNKKKVLSGQPRRGNQAAVREMSSLMNRCR